MKAETTRLSKRLLNAAAANAMMNMLTQIFKQINCRIQKWNTKFYARNDKQSEKFLMNEWYLAIHTDT